MLQSCAIADSIPSACYRPHCPVVMHPEMNQEFYAALMESLLASQGCLFSSPDHKEPHSPIGVEKAYVGLTVHRANSEEASESTGW